MKYKFIPMMVLAAASTMFAASTPAGHATRDTKGRLDIWNSNVARTTVVTHTAQSPAAVNHVQRDAKGRMSIWQQTPEPQTIHHATATSHAAAQPGLHPDAKGRLSEWNKA